MSGTRSEHVLRQGVYAPVPTTFAHGSSDQLDLSAFSRAVARLAKVGVGIIIGGTLGEGPLLSQQERIALVTCARQSIDELGIQPPVPVICGIMGASVLECTAWAEDAAKAGADAGIVVAPAYFAFVYGKDKSFVKDFFTSVADASPLPVILYNIPFAAGGIDLDAPSLLELSEHQNIAGVKLTCLNIAKGHRVALHVNAPEYKDRHPLPFLVLPGSTDYLLPALIGRQHGCMGGPANIYPKVCMKIFRLGKQALETGDFEALREAQRLQDIVTQADSVINKVGFLGIKAAMVSYVDKQANGASRKPLPEVTAEAMEELRSGLAEVVALEHSLP